MYCKYSYSKIITCFFSVLIVAKCIVNVRTVNSLRNGIKVLIVAKCIVNRLEALSFILFTLVLIVAKCIVNDYTLFHLYFQVFCINSSKVYCKYRSAVYQFFIF